MGKFKRVSVTLPSELLEQIDAKCKSNGMTRQQTLAALVDLGLRGGIWPSATATGVIGPLEAIALLREVEGTSDNWARGHLRQAIWKHLTALVKGVR